MQKYEHVKDLFENGSLKITQNQWKRKYNGVMIQEIQKEIFARQKRFVLEDGDSKPYTDFVQFQQYENKTLKYDKTTNKFILSNII